MGKDDKSAVGQEIRVLVEQPVIDSINLFRRELGIVQARLDDYHDRIVKLEEPEPEKEPARVGEWAMWDCKCDEAQVWTADFLYCPNCNTTRPPFPLGEYNPLILRDTQEGE